MRRSLIAALAVFIPVFAAGAGISADASVRIVVNPHVKGTQIPRATVTSIFLKQAPRWTDGVPIAPVDQSVKSPIRNTFSINILQQQLMDVQIYWQRKMAAGVAPPPVKTSDEDVIAFVAATPGAIGYISTSTALPDTVKAIEVVN